MIEDYKGILVVGEIYDGKIRPVTFQLISKARELADTLNTSLSVVLVGHNIGDMAKEPFYYGADKVYVMDNQIFDPYIAEVYSKSLSKFIKNLKPEIVLIPATHTGREYGPRIA
ncbi:MAG: electron transfer flavoprotein subunit alpha/FixB family protein, partial [Thermoplasmata archaeon]